MGKMIVIKDVDFSAVAIKKEVELTTFQGFLSVTHEDGGKAGTYVNMDKRLWAAKSDRTPVLIKAGESVQLNGLKGTTDNEKALRVDYCYFDSNDQIPIVTEAMTGENEHLVGTASNFVSSNYFPLNTNGASSIVITNNNQDDYYYAFAFKSSDNSAITASNYVLSITEV